MKCVLTLEHWEWPILEAEPSDLDFIEITIREPSITVMATIRITVDDAKKFGERLIALSRTLETIKS